MNSIVTLTFSSLYVMGCISQESMGLVLLRLQEMSIIISWQYSTSTSNIMSQWVLWRICMRNFSLTSYVVLKIRSKFSYHVWSFFSISSYPFWFINLIASKFWCTIAGSAEWSWICAIKLRKIPSWWDYICYWKCFPPITYGSLLGWCHWGTSFVFL